jgi:hypothetical protein
MTEAASLVVTVSGRDIGAEALINRVMALGRQADATLARSGANIGTNFSAGVNRATNSSLAFQQAQARLEAQQGNLAGAANRLRNALAQQTTTTVQTINAQRQLLSVSTQLATGQTGLARAFSEAGAAAKSSLLGIVGPAAGVSAAIGVATTVVNSFVEAFKFKAALDATTASINAQLKGVRDVNVVYAEAATFARQFKLTQEETTNAISASIGVMRSSKAPIEDILGVLARMQVLSPEQSLQEAAIALKALASGDTTSLVTRFEVGRDVANQMKAEIQGGADAVAVMSKFLGETGIGMDTLAARATGAAGALKDAAIAAGELKLAQAEFAAGPGMAVLQTQISATRGLTRLLSGDFDAMGQSISNAAANSAHQIGVMAGVTDNATSSSGAWGAELANLTPAIYGEIAAAQQAQAAILAMTQAQTDDIAQTQIDTQAKAEQTAQTALLAAQTQATVDAFLALNPNLSASGAAAAAGAAGFPPLIARLIEATLRAQEARNALAAFNALAGVQALRAPGSPGGGPTDADEIQSGKRNQVVALRNARVKGAQDAEAAEIRYQQTLGNSGPALARANADLVQIGKTRGTDSADYINQLNKIAQLEQQAAAAAKKGRGGGGAGTAKLSDQAKLNNSLLANEEKYHDQAEQAALDHERKLLDIEREFQERSLQQQRANETGKRESRGSFYRTLLLDTEGISPQVQQSLSGAYEAAFARSQELAQAGNAKLAADYLALKEEQLAAEAQFQADLAKARADGDKDLVTRLEAVHALEAQAAAEREKQLLAGGDADVAARDKALTEEEQRYAEQTGKIGTAADQAAERKILAAERAGKAIDAENLKLAQQEQLLNRIGGAGGVPPAGAQPAGTPATTPTAPATPVEAQGGIAAALEGIISAVNAMKDAVTREQGNTTSAVKGLSGRLVG